MSQIHPVVVESIEFLSEGSLIKGWLYRPEDLASSSAVVLCHGAFEHQNNWAGFARRFAENGFASLTFDFTGHGASAGLHSLVDMSVWAYNLRDALNYLSRQKIQRFALVGWGSGGSAALLAAAHDARIEGVVILSAPVLLMPGISDRIAYSLASLIAWFSHKLRHKPFFLSRLREMEKIEMAVNPEVNERYYADPLVRQALQAVPIPESLHCAWVDITASLAKIKAPVLVLHGEKDKQLPLRQSDILMNKLAGRKKFEKIEAGGHALHLDACSEAVFILMVKWVKQHLSMADA